MRTKQKQNKNNRPVSFGYKSNPWSSVTFYLSLVVRGPKTEETDHLSQLQLQDITRHYTTSNRHWESLKMVLQASFPDKRISRVIASKLLSVSPSLTQRTPIFIYHFLFFFFFNPFHFKGSPYIYFLTPAGFKCNPNHPFSRWSRAFYFVTTMPIRPLLRFWLVRCKKLMAAAVKLTRCVTNSCYFLKYQTMVINCSALLCHWFRRGVTRTRKFNS